MVALYIREATRAESNWEVVPDIAPSDYDLFRDR